VALHQAGLHDIQVLEKTGHLGEAPPGLPGGVTLAVPQDQRVCVQHVPLDPTAQTMPAPGLLDVESSTLGLPLSGLATCVHSVPFQFRVRVCGT
jgi:hypothetical protein